MAAKKPRARAFTGYAGLDTSGPCPLARYEIIMRGNDRDSAEALMADTEKVVPASVARAIRTVFFNDSPVGRAAKTNGTNAGAVAKWVRKAAETLCADEER